MSQKRSHLEEGFIRLYESVAADAPQPEREYRFHETRKWRFDFAWPKHLVALEIDGGIFVGGGHTRGLQFAGNCEKLREAVKLGWRVMRYTTLDLRKQPVQMVEEIVWLLNVVDTRDVATQVRMF